MIEAACSPPHIIGSSAAWTHDFASPGRDSADAALVGLAGSELAGRFRHWHGASGRRYLFSVFALEGAGECCPRYEDAVVLAVRRAEDETRRILWAGQSGALPDAIFDGDALRRAIAEGANEVHMHLLAKDQAARNLIVFDIGG